jgi:hypothetical protein
VTATGGDGGGEFNGNGGGGPGGTATATGIATALGSGAATANVTAAGGNAPFAVEGGGMSGGGAVSHSSARSSFGGAASVANATGGSGGSAFGGGSGGAGGAATATSDSNSGATGNATSTAGATGGPVGFGDNIPNRGGAATASSNASAAGGGMAMAKAVATGGVGGQPNFGLGGVANATSTAETARGALAQAQSTAVGVSGQAQSTAKTSLAGVNVQSTAAAPISGTSTNSSTATTNTIAQGGAGQAFAIPGQTAYAFSTALPDKAYATTLVGGASDVASALLGPRDAVFGTDILGANSLVGVSNTYSASSTFDFGYGGDLQLGLIDDQVSGFANGVGFQSMEFTIQADGVQVLDVTFGSLAIAESFFRDDVIDLGADFGPNIDLTFGYTLIADGPGGFGFDLAIGGAVPEPSTWAMMLVGFAGLGFAGHRSTETRRRRPCGLASD